MKNLLYSTCCLVFLALGLTLDVVAGGNENNNRSGATLMGPGSLQATNSGHVLDKGFYFLLGTNSATSKYGTPTNMSVSNGDNPFGTGFRFELGNYFPLVDLTQELSFMARVSWFGADINYFRQDVANTDNQTMNFNSTMTLLNFGPQFSYSPADNFAIDGYLVGGLNAVAGYTGYVNSIDNGVADISNFGHWGWKGWRVSPGVSVRYSVFMLGFEYNWSRTEGNYDDPDGDFTMSNRFNSYRFYLGLKLNQR